MSLRRLAMVSLGVMAGLVVGCTPAANFTPGTADAPRTVRVSTFDRNEFFPARITVRAGETVRFVVTNEGEQEHEFMLGSRHEMLEHSISVTHGGHGVDSAYEIRLLPGQTKDLVWTFGSSTDIGYACFVRSHYPASMMGGFDIVP